MIVSSIEICRRSVNGSQRLNHTCLMGDASASLSQAEGVSGQMVNRAKWRESLRPWDVTSVCVQWAWADRTPLGVGPGAPTTHRAGAKWSAGGLKWSGAWA